MDTDDRPHTAKSAGEVTHVSAVTTFSGPLPPPLWLAEYERIHPGTASRLLDHAEAEARHRRSLAELRVRAEGRYGSRGQWMAFGLSLTSLGIAGWLAAASGPWAATPFALTALTPIVAAFLRQRGRSEASPRP